MANPRPTVADICRASETVFSLPAGTLMETMQSKRFPVPRRAAIWVAKRNLGLSNEALAQRFNRDESSIRDSLRFIEMTLSRDAGMAGNLERLWTHAQTQASKRAERECQRALTCAVLHPAERKRLAHQARSYAARDASHASIARFLGVDKEIVVALLEDVAS